MSRVIQVFEFEKLTIHKDELDRQLTKKELEKLYEFNDKNDNCYFTGIRDGVKFKNFVGVIQIGGLTIEILPKTDKNKSIKEDYNTWHKALINMLRICKHINITSMSEANLKKKHNSILELYFEMYLDEVEQLLRVGLIKKYRKYSSNILALKGRLDFNKNIQQNLIHQERFYTSHQIYDYENIVNQILLRGLTILKSLTNNSILSDRINRVNLNFPEIKEISIQKHHFEQIKDNRKIVPYSKALQIAKMLILNYSPDIISGQENMLTLLFDMNKLWEEYIYRMLIRSKSEVFNVSPQDNQKFWENRTIRPDIVITHKNSDISETYIIDTKWKIIEANKPSDNDLKQMFAYNMYWDAKKSMLLYPSSKSIIEGFGNYHKGRELKEYEKDVEIEYDRTNQCKVGFINVLDENNQLNLDIGKDIFEKIVMK
ncbi:McrC family protein [Lutibacter citreus]|uniref:McrC family protein n=1 Tax=Lutibacter citreus TaxID=2138210 RepID=UPI000DBDFFEB|nr:restriction endonuclease [Lutibacter citreus]